MPKNTQTSKVKSTINFPAKNRPQVEERPVRATAEFFMVADFERLHHDRRRASAPWVKFHHDLLDNHLFLGLTDQEKWWYCALLLVARRTDNKISSNKVYLKRMLGSDVEPDLTWLFERGFLLAWSKRKANKQLAKRQQKACLDKEEDREKDQETEKEEKGKKKEKAEPTTSPSFLNFEEMTITPEIIDWAESKNITVNLPDALEQFKDHHRASTKDCNNYLAAFRGWLRIAQIKATASIGKNQDDAGEWFSMGEQQGEAFRKFWNLYPKKVNPRSAWNVWAQLNPDESLANIIFSAVERHKGHPNGFSYDDNYIPHPATWLNDARYHDELSVDFTPAS